MPIGLFENELTVQLWKPVTIRGFTFNVGDNVTLDQTKVQKTAAVGGDFAWLFATYQARSRPGPSFETLLEPAAAAACPRGEQGADPLADALPQGSVRDPAGGPAADAAVPLRQGGERVHARETEELANYFAARDGAEFPYQTIPSSR